MRDVPHISTFMDNHKTFSTSHAKYENVKNVPQFPSVVTKQFRMGFNSNLKTGTKTGGRSFGCDRMCLF